MGEVRARLRCQPGVAGVDDRLEGGVDRIHQSCRQTELAKRQQQRQRRRGNQVRRCGPAQSAGNPRQHDGVCSGRQSRAVVEVHQSRQRVDDGKQIPRPVGEIAPGVVLVHDDVHVVLAVGEGGCRVVDQGQGETARQIGGEHAEFRVGEHREGHRIRRRSTGILCQGGQFAINDQGALGQRRDHHGPAVRRRILDLVVECNATHGNGLVDSRRRQAAAHQAHAGRIVHHLGAAAGEPVPADHVGQQVVPVQDRQWRTLQIRGPDEIQPSHRQIADRVRVVERSAATHHDPALGLRRRWRRRAGGEEG